MLKLLKKGILIILTLFLVHSYIGTLFIYYNNNMYPSIKDGDLCFIQKYDKQYKQDDIVLYKADSEGLHYKVTLSIPDSPLSYILEMVITQNKISRVSLIES